MPIEIKELHIKVSINPPEEGAAPGDDSASVGSSAAPIDQDEIIAACIEQVLQILQEKREA